MPWDAADWQLAQAATKLQEGAGGVPDAAVYVAVTPRIPAGTELLLDYGAEYWRKHKAAVTDTAIQSSTSKGSPVAALKQTHVAHCEQTAEAPSAGNKPSAKRRRRQ